MPEQDFTFVSTAFISSAFTSLSSALLENVQGSYIVQGSISALYKPSTFEGLFSYVSGSTQPIKQLVSAFKYQARSCQCAYIDIVPSEIRNAANRSATLFIIYLPNIISRGIELILNRPLEIESIFNEEYQEFEFDIPELNIFATGSTTEELIEELQDDIVWLWQEYVESDDDTLSLDALDMKRYLQELVKEVRFFESAA